MRLPELIVSGRHRSISEAQRRVLERANFLLSMNPPQSNNVGEASEAPLALQSIPAKAAERRLYWTAVSQQARAEHWRQLAEVAGQHNAQATEAAYILWRLRALSSHHRPGHLVQPAADHLELRRANHRYFIDDHELHVAQFANKPVEPLPCQVIAAAGAQLKNRVGSCRAGA